LVSNCSAIEFTAWCTASVVSATTHEGSSGALRLAGSGYRSQDFSRAGVHHASSYCHCRLGIAFLRAADPELAGEATEAPASNCGVLVVAPELRDTSKDYRVNTQDPTDFGCRRGIGSVAIGKVLLGQYFIQGIALDYGIFPILDQFLYEQVGNAFADILVCAKDRGDRTLHGAIFKIQDCQAFL
jgi:hypothetical protein